MKKLIAILSLVTVLAISIAGIALANSPETIVSNQISIVGTVYNSPSNTSGGGVINVGSPAPNIAGIQHNNDGIVYEDVTATSTDGIASLYIPSGTVAKDKNGNALWTVRIDLATNIPPLPEGKNIIGIPYEFSPNGATFDPAITITFRYDPNTVPDNNELKLVFWNGTEWVELTDVVVNPETGEVSGKTTHFTKFALFSVPKPMPTITTTTPTTTPVVTTTVTTPVVTTTPVITTTPIETTTTIIEHTQTDTTTQSVSTTIAITPDEKNYIAITITIIVAILLVAIIVVVIANRKKIEH